VQLREAQMQTLGEQHLSAFLGRFEQFAQDRVGRAPERPLSQALFDRGRSYGLLSEQELVGYMLLAWGAGARPPTPDPEWILTLMTDPHRTAEDKIRTLFDLAEQRAGVRA